MVVCVCVRIGLVLVSLTNCVLVCVCVCVCVRASAGGFCGLLHGAKLNTGEGEVHCPELHLPILYQQTERRLGQLCCS